MSSLSCLYVHDHTFKKMGNDHYSEGKITDEVFYRYVTCADNLAVYSRMKHIQDAQSLTKITGKNIKFSPVKGQSFSAVFSKHLVLNFNLAKKEIIKSDFLVVRLPSFLGLFVLLLNIFFRKKYFIELVGDPKEALITSKVNVNIAFKIFVNIFALLNSFFIKRASGVIYVTESALQARYPTSSLQTYASNVELNVENLIFPINKYYKNKTLKIGLIGSFNNSYKGIDDAIQSVKFLKDKEIYVYLHILGSGKLKKEYLDLAKAMQIEDQIIFDGILSGGKAVNQWLDSLDLYIQPSRTEGLPRSLIEAMARGLPAIATNVGGVPELLSSNFLIEPNSPKKLARKIEEFIQSEQLCYEQGNINYNKAKHYDSRVLKKRRERFWSQARSIVIEELK